MKPLPPLFAEQRSAMNVAGGILGMTLVGLLFFLAWAFIFRELPANNREPMLMLLGIVSTNVGQVVGFYFGSSWANKKQADTIDTLSKVAATPTGPTIVAQAGDTVTTDTASSSSTTVTTEPPPGVRP